MDPSTPTLSSPITQYTYSPDYLLNLPKCLTISDAAPHFPDPGFLQRTDSNNQDRTKLRLPSQYRRFIPLGSLVAPS